MIKYRSGLTAILVLFIFLILFCLKNLDYFNPSTASLIINRYPWPNPLIQNNNPILSGQKLNARFLAPDNRLGIIAVAFDTDSQKIYFDTVIFRIKTQGEKNWYYENTYTNIKHSHDFIPFGFPVIENSQGKIFEFEIESITGRPGNALSLSRRFPFFFTKSSFPLEYLIKHRSEIAPFLWGKFSSVLNLLTSLPVSNYIYILGFGLFFSLISFAAKNRSLIPLSFFPAAALLIFGLVLSVLFLPLNEVVEWRLYAVSAVSLVGLMPLLQLFAARKRLFSVQLLALAGGVIGLLLLLTQSLTGKEIVVLVIMAVMLLKFHFSSEALIFNLLAGLAVLGFFNLSFPGYSWWLCLGVIAFSLGAFFFLPYFSRKVKLSILFPGWLLVLILLPLIFWLHQKRIDFHHYFLYLGPAFDFAQGKSLLVDTPSQFGYLSISFVATILKSIGFSLSRFHALNTLIYITNAILGILVLFRLVKSKLLALTASIVFISFQTIFTYYYQILYPSSGPLRFGLGMLIIFILTYFPRKLGLFIAAFVSALAVCWSFEVGVFIVPAWIASLLANHFLSAKSFKAFIRQTAPGLGFFSLCLIGLLLAIYLNEYRLQGQSPWLMAYISNALTYTRYADGLGALPIPAFGNYYLLILILVLGLSVASTVVINRINSRYLALLVFICLHNLAIFSYYIGRSHENNIVNIAGYFLIELVVILIVLVKDLKASRRDLYHWLALPGIIFLSLFSLRLSSQAKAVIPFSHQTYQSNQGLWLSPSIAPSALAAALNNLQIAGREVVLLSPKNDTRLLVESNLINALPLNPSQMTFYLGSGWLKQYIYPAVSVLKVGTIVIIDQAAASSFLDPVIEAISQAYRLEKLGSVPEENLEILVIAQPLSAVDK